MTRRRMARQGSARCGAAGVARCGPVGLGRYGETRRDEAGTGIGAVSRGLAGNGQVRLGIVRQGKVLF